MNDSYILIPRELLDNALDELYELRGQISWWADEPRCNYKKRYNLLSDTIIKIETILKENNE